MRRRSAASEALPSPTTKRPFRIAYQLNTVEMAVNAADASMLARKFGVPRSQWIRSSVACEKTAAIWQLRNPPSTRVRRRETPA